MKTYENEKKVILMSVIKDRTEKEKEELHKIVTTNVLDWGYISGVLVNNRLGGYFYNFIDSELRYYVLPEFMRTLELICKAQDMLNRRILELLKPVFLDMEEAKVRFAALKGLVYLTSIYPYGARRSNDCDVLVCEEDLDILDDILRKNGFIQSSDNGISEASKKAKLIQRMNYHDLIPYAKQVDMELQKHIRIDVNFHIDDKDNDITKEIYALGTREHIRDDNRIVGLISSTHFLHLCIHFHREASNTLWTEKRRDVLLYKVVDIINTYRTMSEDEINESIKLSKTFNLEKAVYFTFYYINIFYPDLSFEKIMAEYDIEKDDFLYEIKVEGKGIIVNREQSFYDKAFTIEYCNNFSKRE